jgi:hypothetical protein
VQLEHNSKYKIFILRNKLRGVVIWGYGGDKSSEKVDKWFDVIGEGDLGCLAGLIRSWSCPKAFMYVLVSSCLT